MVIGLDERSLGISKYAGKSIDKPGVEVGHARKAEIRHGLMIV